MWATEDGEQLLGFMARVSNPNATPEDPSDKLIRYLIKHQHWSPFEMVNVCVEINCPRDISRQILRHRSFSFQEFSGRYASYGTLEHSREARLQHPTNRQSSLPIDNLQTKQKWDWLVQSVRSTCFTAYDTALRLGIAKEVARVLLPEGLVPTKMYMNGTLRSWIHYVNIRTGPETQKEHRDVALEVQKIIKVQYPIIAEAVGW